MKTIVTLDLGTTSCRALLFDLQGRVLASASRTYPLHTPKPGWAEQDPEQLLLAADSTIREVADRANPSDVLGVSLCTYMHSLVALDAEGRYLTPMTTWADNRPAAQVEALRAQANWFDIYSRTGCPPHTMYPLYKYMWYKANQPDLLRSAHRWVSIKELLVHRWTGQWALDYNLATGSGLLNMHTLTWDEEALALAGVRPDQLSAVVPTTHTLPLTTSNLGLLLGTPVVLGAGDGVLSSLGSGCIESGVVAAMVGTSGAVRACVPEPTVDPKARVFCYYLDKNRWILGGSLNNGGIALRWMRDNFYPGVKEYEPLIEEASRVPLGAGGLLFLPYLAGERSPGFNVRARGVWFGLGLEHGRAHMTRSVLEAVAFRLYSVLGPIEELIGGSAREIRATGGYAQSPYWLQICADVFGREVAVPAQAEGSSLGAYVMGAVALGVAPGLSSVDGLVSVRERLQPDRQNHARYEELFGIYQQVSHNVQAQFHALAQFRGE
ncbi:MAG: gluconokinase [Mycobacterium leprae]